MPKDKGKDIGIRLGSMLLDHLIMTFASSFVAFIIVGLVLLVMHLFFNLDIDKDFFPVMMIVFTLTVYPIYFNKDAIGGRSPAKRILKLIVINGKTGEVAGPVRNVVRNVTLFFWPLEVVFILISPDRRLGDMIAGTKVVEDNSSKRRTPKFIELIASFLLSVGYMIPFIWLMSYLTGFYF